MRICAKGWASLPYKAVRMFVVSKLLALVLAPLNALFLAVLAVAALGFTRWRRLQRPVLALLVLVWAAVAAVPWDMVLLRPLENRFPPPPLPARVDGVVVLGGALDPVLSQARGQVAAGAAVERLTALVHLGRLYPEARLVFTGGSGSLTRQDAKEAPVARRFLAELGFDPSKVVFEDQSRNTRENATLTKELAAPKAGETWLLVTSALHMPRSVGTFRAAGWTVTAYPVDYLTAPAGGGFGFDPAAAFSRLDIGLHEWLGLLYYRLRGWSDSAFPSP